MKTICIIIGIICLYCDISAIQQPQHMRGILQSIMPVDHHSEDVR